MVTASPVAASGTNTVATSVIAGRINPTAPSTSSAPMDLIVFSEKSSTQASSSPSSSFDLANFIAPAMRNIKASTICRIHNTTFITGLLPLRPLN